MIQRLLQFLTCPSLLYTVFVCIRLYSYFWPLSFGPKHTTSINIIQELCLSNAISLCSRASLEAIGWITQASKDNCPTGLTGCHGASRGYLFLSVFRFWNFKVFQGATCLILFVLNCLWKEGVIFADPLWQFFSSQLLRCVKLLQFQGSNGLTKLCQVKHSQLRNFVHGFQG